MQILGVRPVGHDRALQPVGSAPGSVSITPPGGTPPTTVLVRQITDGSWVVLSARTESIRLDTPIGHTRISPPQPLIGAAYAFEGRVNVMLYADGDDVPIATSFVMGRGDGVLGDFRASSSSPCRAAPPEASWSSQPPAPKTGRRSPPPPSECASDP